MARTERPQIEEAEFTAAIDLQAANAPAVKAEQELAEIKSAFGEEQRRTTLLIGQRVGRKQMINAIQKLVTVTDLIDLQNIKETKQYKGYEHITSDGKLVIITTFSEYCLYVEGRSAEAVNLDLLNLKVLGEEFFDAMRQIGIGPGTMRDLRALPEDERQALLQVAQEADKDAFVDLASTLIAKHEADKQAAKKQHDELKATLDAKDAVVQKKQEELAKKDRMIDGLNERIALHERKALTATPDEKALAARDAVLRAAERVKAAVMADLRAAIKILVEDAPGQHALYASACLIEIGRELAILRGDFNLPDTLSESLMPEWLTQEDLDTIQGKGA